MKITDTFDDIWQCYPNGRFDMSCWERYAGKISPAFADKIKNDTSDYDFEREVLPVLQAAYADKDRVCEAHGSFCKAVCGLAEKVREKLGCDLDVHIVLYLELCSGAGWATELDGVPAVLLGIEKIAELRWTDEKTVSALIYHELGHIWHYRARNVRTEPKNPAEKALWQLYGEGAAMYAEQLIYGAENFYHQDKNGWLRWCTENRGRLFGEFLKRVKSGESAGRFFGDRNDFEGYSDVGYYLGCELVRSMAESRSLDGIANAELSEIEAELEKLSCV
ncbi:MAG: hypothetical protein NC395_10565 [Prevotella sp.]|nr:hypothetical protein [Prevotella sp.]